LVLDHSGLRSPGWAAKAITLTCWKTIPKYAIELDISKCFDSISHEFILDHVSNIKFKQNTYQVIPNQIIKQWLKSGYIDVIGDVTPNDQLIPTEVGVGGPISPTISNIVLNGIENAVDNLVRISEYVSDRQSIHKNTKILWFKDGKPFLSTLNCLNQNDICFELSKAGLFELNSCQPRDLFRSKKYENYGLSFEYIHFEK
jgi:retron-type reverse transcriptase